MRDAYQSHVIYWCEKEIIVYLCPFIEIIIKLLILKWNDNEEENKAKHPLSARKIAFMLRRLEEDGFTSYWLS